MLFVPTTVEENKTKVKEHNTTGWPALLTAQVTRPTVKQNLPFLP